jgi:hypothetical protein
MQHTLALIALLVFVGLHQDFWLWDDARLVMGFLPAGLAYHAAYSVITAGLWALIVRYAWPAGLDEADRPPVRSKERAQ